MFATPNINQSPKSHSFTNGYQINIPEKAYVHDKNSNTTMDAEVVQRKLNPHKMACIQTNVILIFKELPFMVL
jgi:hypothetical protein